MPFKFNPITGKLDLVQTPLDLSGYVPYTGATNDLDLGANDFSILNPGSVLGFLSSGMSFDSSTGAFTAGNNCVVTPGPIAGGVAIGTSINPSSTPAFSVTADGDYAVAINGLANGQGAMAIGQNSSAVGAGNVSLGTDADANGAFNVCIGQTATVGTSTGFSNNCVAIGRRTKVGDTSTLYTESVAIGADIVLTGNRSVVIGTGTSADKLELNADDQMLFGFADASSQQNLIHAEKDAGVRVGALTGETITMTGTDLFVDGHAEIGGVLYLNPVTLLGSPVSGAIEYSDDRFYITDVATQRVIDRTSDVKLTTTTVANTTTETVLYTGVVPANSLKAGNKLKVFIDGLLGTLNSSQILTIRVKMNGTTISTISSTGTNYTDAPWSAKLEITVRSIGATASIAVHTDLDVGKSKSNAEQKSSIETIDTTVSENITITAQWSSANASNTISCHQGHLETKG